MKKILTIALLFVLTTFVKAQTLTVTGPSSANSGADITFTVHGETSNYYLTNVTVDMDNSTYPVNIVLNQPTFGLSGQGKSASTFVDQALFRSNSSSNVSTNVTFVFLFTVYNNTVGSGVGDNETVSASCTVTIIPPPANSSNPPTQPTGGALTSPLYRLYNSGTQYHFYTSSTEEKNEVLNSNPKYIMPPSFFAFLFGNKGSSYWSLEGNQGNVYISQQSGSVPLRRLFNSNNGQHMYSISNAEVSQLLGSGWTDEGIVGYVYSSNTSGAEALYRYYSSKAGHFFTVNQNEIGLNSTKDWTYEGIACWVLYNTQ